MQSNTVLYITNRSSGLDYCARNELEIARRRIPPAVAGRVATYAERIGLLVAEAVEGFHCARRVPEVSGPSGD